MTAPLDRPATRDGLFLWLMERLTERFHDQAILKGGLAMRLLDSPRSTTDIDYVFVPYTSKREVLPGVEEVLGELEEAEVSVSLHSTMLRATVRIDDVAVQLEANVAESCGSTPMSTGGMARTAGRAPCVLRIMSPDWALAHKLAAWAERRLLRDLYDCAFFVGRLGQRPAGEVLDQRLADLRSQHPAMAGRGRMERAELARELRRTLEGLTDADLRAELGPLLPPEELAGLLLRIRAAVALLAEWLET